MADTTDTATAIPYVWTQSLSIIGGIGTVVWAASEHKKGKFWWFLGGYFAFGALGFIIDSATNN